MPTVNFFGSIQNTNCEATQTPQIVPIPQIYLKNKLILKLQELEKKTSRDVIWVKNSSSSFFRRIASSVDFFRRHPLADYSDPGPYPSSLKNIKSFFSARKNWEKRVKKILPLQHYLFEQTCTLYHSKNYLENKFENISKEIDKNLNVYAQNLSLKIISILYLTHHLKKPLQIEEILPTLDAIGVNIKKEGALLCCNFLELFYSDPSCQNSTFSTGLLQTLSTHLQVSTPLYNSTRTFSGF